jgi:anti-sigma B factor antagonist
MKHCKLKRAESIAILTPRGALTGGEETDEVQEMIRSLGEQGNMRLIVTLSEVDMLNSWALGVLIGGYVSYKNRGGRVVLCALNHKIQTLLIITKLISVFDVYDNEELALASFAASSPSVS